MLQVSSERDRLRAHRDMYAKQFEDLSRLRNTETEGLFEQYREKVEIQSKGEYGVKNQVSVDLSRCFQVAILLPREPDSTKFTLVEQIWSLNWSMSGIGRG